MLIITFHLVILQHECKFTRQMVLVLEKVWARNHWSQKKLNKAEFVGFFC